MPLRTDTADRATEISRAVDHLIVERGIGAITMRNVAALVGRSPAALSNHRTNRERLVRVSAAITARARLDGIHRRVRTDGVRAFLPAADDEVLQTRAWLGWLELWRSDAGLTQMVGAAREEERELLAWALDHTLPREPLDLTMATIDGLRTAVCAPVQPMPLRRAADLLELSVRALGGRCGGRAGGD